MKKLYLISSFLILTSCVSTPLTPEYNSYIKDVKKTLTVYNREEVSWSFEKGTGILIGSGFLVQNSGNVVKCSGKEVALYPVSSYSKERFRNIYGSVYGGFNPASLPRRVDTANYQYTQDRITSTCDIDGKFKFTNLPAGQFYVVTQVIWTGYNTWYEGGYISKRVVIEEGKTTEVILN